MTTPEAAHAACELGMDDAPQPKPFDGPGAAAWVAVVTVALAAVLFKILLP